LLGAAYGHLGREQEARQAVATLNKLRMQTAGNKRSYPLEDLKFWSVKNEAGLSRLREGMRRAGIPPG